ncbi:MAG: carboxymuconolactone decarboxylase family protein [Candidatus Spyradocola sp.]|jgi:4-carboxymuconolactone decarboxylase
MENPNLDPEFSQCMENFLEEVRTEPGQQLPETTRWLAILATLLGCQGIDEFRNVLPQALDAGVSPVQAKEVVYQAVDYLGIGRVRPFLGAVNEVLAARGVALPLPGQATTTKEDRLEKGEQAQVAIFGEGLRGAWKQGTIQRWLAANCFGDFYTRTGLSPNEREMITFCFLAAQGGCEPQLTAHANGNMNLGNGEAFLTRVVLQCLPYIGYPRSLNALACVQKAAQARKGGAL